MKTAAILPILALAPLLGLTAATESRAQQSHTANQCFFTRDIQNYLAPDDRTLYLRVRNSAIYRIDLVNACPEMPMNIGRIALQTVAGSGMICRAIDLDLKVSSNGTSTACLIKSLHKLTPEEAAALPKEDRP
jgi:hypothetical protein